MEDYCSVMNPYAIAELLLGKRIRWNTIKDKKSFLEKAFGFPYAHLFDPKFKSPIFGLPEKEIKKYAFLSKLDFSGIKKDDYKKRISIVEKEIVPKNIGIDVDWYMKLNDKTRWVFLNLWFLELAETTNEEYTPENASWRDIGDFYEEGTEFSDPVQGHLGDCYLIAALCSIAWTRPYIIAHRNIPTGNAQNAFLDRITFYDSGNPVDIDVTEELPVDNTTNTLKYARSSEDGELWCGIYEKAYAKWITNNPTDRPNYAPLRGGSPRRTAAHITNLSGTRISNSTKTEDELWHIVRQHSIGKKTFDPMFACTYPSADDAPNPINYADANISANHCYSILGWDFVNSKKYIVIRNPWGHHEAELNILNGFWNPIRTPGNFQQIELNNNGVFAIEADTFKKYYASISWVA
ncbi:MAG: C2 family cysteine protease [Arcicella sp.]|nr:C2 family cysteine protease [Arcicella sp.]